MAMLLLFWPHRTPRHDTTRHDTTRDATRTHKQAKRLNIGLALITDPRVLYLDEVGVTRGRVLRACCCQQRVATSAAPERCTHACTVVWLTTPTMRTRGVSCTHAILSCMQPTSGLDSFTAYEVMAVVAALAREGTTVASTIHGPSAACFDLFDQLLVLNGGRVVYLGASGDAAIRCVRARLAAGVGVGDQDRGCRVPAAAGQQPHAEAAAADSCCLTLLPATPPPKPTATSRSSAARGSRACTKMWPSGWWKQSRWQTGRQQSMGLQTCTQPASWRR
jgi:hypothetical protein